MVYYFTVFSAPGGGVLKQQGLNRMAVKALRVAKLFSNYCYISEHIWESLQAADILLSCCSILGH